MAKISLAIDISKLSPNDPQFNLYVGKILSELVTIINGQVGLSENCDARFVPNVTFKNANVEQAVTHGLNRVPQGYLVAGSQAATTVYNGTSTWSTNAIYLRATVATTCNLLLF